MTNKYKAVQDVLPRQVERPSKLAVHNPTLGFRSDVSPREMPLEATPDSSDVAYERGAIRKDFGWVSIGTAAASKVLALGEYKFIFGPNLTQRTIRIWRNAADGKAVAEIWDGALWTELIRSSTPIEPVYLAMAAIQNILALADGKRVLRLSEVDEPSPLQFDFPTGEEIQVVGELTQLTVTGITGQVDQTGTVKFRVTFDGTGDTILQLGFYVNGVLEETLLFSYIAGVDPDPDAREDLAELVRDNWADGDVVKIQVDDIVGGVSTIDVIPIATIGADNPGGPPPASHQIDKSVARPDIKDTYAFKITVTKDLPDEGGNSITIGIYTTVDNGVNWVKQGANEVFNAPGTREVIRVIADFDGAGPDFKFAVNRETSDVAAQDWSVGCDVTYSRTNVKAKGFNKAVDVDPDAGLTLQETVQELRFEPIGGAPAGRYVFSFDDRLVVLQDGVDAQSLAWSVGGDVLDFRGVDSGQIFLVSPRIDSIDALMCGAPLASNVAALIRQRSIMRVFPTGNVAQALGAVHWIEGIGTEARFSLQVVLGGVMFLGHDFMVYYLTEQGPQPVGLTVQQELLERLSDSDLELVDSAYDVVLGRYILGIPEDGAVSITALWQFDLKRFLERRQVVWWRRPVTAQRLGWTSVVL